jgi:hypothetical protein
MSKKIFFFLNLIFLLTNPIISKADISDGLLFKPALSLELQSSNVNAKSLNNNFESQPFEKQLKGFNNIALGLNFRIHKYFGLNLNWSQFSLRNQNAIGHTLQNKSNLSIENMNFSSLFYFPIIGDDLVDGFIEVGVSDINSNFKFTDSGNTNHTFKDHESAFLYGAGIEIAPYELETAFRISAQRYITKLKPINGDITIWRAGIIKYF